MWIETQTKKDADELVRVTPHTGVWIETICVRLLSLVLASRPTRACGLKHKEASRARETSKSRPTRACGLKLANVRAKYPFLKSRPTRACGLKLVLTYQSKHHLKSRPTRACGLKPRIYSPFSTSRASRPTRGVWIETLCHQNVINNCVCFSLAYGVFER